MSFTNVTKPTQGDPTKKSLIDAMIDNDNDLNTRVLAISGASLLKNGSFDADGDSDGIPDSWTRTLYTGGTFLLDTTDQQHSTKSVKFTSPGGGGNGGGYIENTDNFDCSPNRPLTVYWEMKSSVADVDNRVEITYYTAAGASISTTTLYSEASANPTSWAGRAVSATPPSTARFAKLRFCGCHDADATAGDTWFDNVYIAPTPNPVPYRESITSGSGNWAVPVGVHKVRVRAWGGGGGGNSGSSDGGGGGAFVEHIFSVEPGDTIAYAVGAAGAIDATGGSTTFSTLTAAGGVGAVGAGVKAGGAASGGFLNVNGQSSFSTTGGAAGGAGGFGGTNGVAGNSPGGGGGGNAAGAAGLIILEY